MNVYITYISITWLWRNFIIDFTSVYPETTWLSLETSFMHINFDSVIFELTPSIPHNIYNSNFNENRLWGKTFEFSRMRKKSFIRLLFFAQFLTSPTPSWHRRCCSTTTRRSKTTKSSTRATIWRRSSILTWIILIHSVMFSFWIIKKWNIYSSYLF